MNSEGITNDIRLRFFKIFKSFKNVCQKISSLPLYLTVFILIILLSILPSVLLLMYRSNLESTLISFQQDVIQISQTANFSFIKIEDGTMTTDIKPEIYTFRKSDHSSSFTYVIDEKSKLNPHYWNVRETDTGTKAKVSGVVLSGNSLNVITSSHQVKVPYRILFGSNSVTYTPEDLSNAVNKLDQLSNSKVLVSVLLVVITTVLITFILLLLSCFCYLINLLLTEVFKNSIRRPFNRSFRNCLFISGTIVLLLTIFLVIIF